MWFCQKLAQTDITSKFKQAALNRTAFVFPVAFKVIPKKCAFAKTGPERYYFQVTAKNPQLWLWIELFFVSQVTL